MDKPNPGSQEAIAIGCKCAVIDNHYGRGFPYPGVDGPAFYINADCPVHAKDMEKFLDSGTKEGGESS